ncbi:MULTISPECIES: GlxA family transcriptional regulator [Caulobacter]|jgi:transcriptional regulator GlxA family with amidase domain|uniref:Transcriptional regulator, AraC family with amidase-like domain containing protein n=1 Tax=Caulobacter vibrioides OR37 TaxID=1292034 RepID=R0EI66_CAUVI|nr:MULTISPECIES: GlxA family transcriptional regulator [Caulobacter]ENZ80887.1 transcriptional regulator, AraC family with amidase-like domain containing protein [Caulobacter vibrioides OR37]MBQ1562774.1 GlxA family transcriptional regulator [Caulobacter sp.]
MPRAIGFLVYPGFQLLDATGPIAAFEIAGRFSPGAYSLHFLSLRGEPTPSSSGVTIHTTALADAPRLDTLLISGGDGVKVPATCPETLAFVREAGRQARRVASVCSGTYVLAEAGLLNGKRATTHWSRTKDFQRRYPDIRLEPDRIWIQDGSVWSSAGITAGIDLALAMIGADEGETIARRTAQQLVVYHHRPGGQSQHSALIDLRPGRFDALLSWARQNLSEPLSVEQLAERAGMSPRNFARQFAQETGVTPAKAVERLRVEAARALLDSGPLQIEDVALETGFGDGERMRRAFIRAFGQPPQALRRAARAG